MITPDLPDHDQPGDRTCAARLAWLERVLKFDYDRGALEAAKREYLALTDPAQRRVA